MVGIRFDYGWDWGIEGWEWGIFIWGGLWSFYGRDRECRLDFFWHVWVVLLIMSLLITTHFFKINQNAYKYNNNNNNDIKHFCSFLNLWAFPIFLVLKMLVRSNMDNYHSYISLFQVNESNLSTRSTSNITLCIVFLTSKC